VTRRAIVLTCEHGGHRVPARWRDRFRGSTRILRSHRGWDPGALGLARRVARRLPAPLRYSTVTRLLVELNRSEHHPRIFSEFVAGCDPEEKERILSRWYRPWRKEVEELIAREVREGRQVLHVSFHTFTPVLGARVRRADVGLLYDPGRPRERRFCARWREDLRAGAPELRVRRNYPYRGSDDGFTTWLRRRFPVSRYLGIELEVNQRLFSAAGRPRSPLVRRIEDSLVRLVRA